MGLSLSVCPASVLCCCCIYLRGVTGGASRRRCGSALISELWFTVCRHVNISFECCWGRNGSRHRSRCVPGGEESPGQGEDRAPGDRKERVEDGEPINRNRALLLARLAQ